jgi:hypothetical protein
MPATDIGDGRLPAQVAGRNDPCPCGSGDKFKRCCQPRLVYQRGRGDCLRAAAATVLGISYDETQREVAAT